MKIAHASDLHGSTLLLEGMAEHPEDRPDLWVFTGDMFPNITRGNRRIEPNFQAHWYAENELVFKRCLQDRTVLLVPGNHDYVDLAKLLRRSGVDAREVTPDGLTYKKIRFAGFGHIPIIAGEWNLETPMSQLAMLTRRTLEVGNPEVLVTHSPPDGILNGYYEGIAPITSALTYRPHRVRLHLFGHQHEEGGKSVEHMGIRFVNSACTVSIIDL